MAHDWIIGTTHPTRGTAVPATTVREADAAPGGAVLLCARTVIIFRRAAAIHMMSTLPQFQAAGACSV